MIYAGTSYIAWRKFALLWLAMLASQCMFAQDIVGAPSRARNFSSFTLRTYELDAVLHKLPATLHAHPDIGNLPLEAACENCYEELDKRTYFSKTYRSSIDQTEWYVEQSSKPTSFLENGYLRHIDYHLHETASNGVYRSGAQPYPTSLNTNTGSSAIEFGEASLTFNNWTAVYQPVTGSPLVHAADWTQVTVGNDGAYVQNIFPGVDLRLEYQEAGVKSDFVITSRIPGIKEIRFRDQISASFNYKIKEGPTNGKGASNLYVNAISGNASFEFGKITVYDSDPNGAKGGFGFYKRVGKSYAMVIGPDLLLDSSAVYPLIIDPFVTVGPTAGTGSIGSLRGAACTQNLNVTWPGGSTPNNVTFNWSVTANACCALPGFCRMSWALVELASSCGGRSPVTPFYWACAGFGCNGPGTWTPTVPYGSSGTTSLATCYTPDCNNQTLTFTFGLLRNGASACTDASGCDCTFATNTCVRLNSWAVTVRGNDLETLNNTTTGNGTSTYTGTCAGTSVLNPLASNGVPGYTYAWTPGGQTSSTITVPNWPNGTVYTCTVTDACGSTRLATFNMNCPLPISLLSMAAELKQDKVELQWVTESEVNNDRFVIQRSLDAQVFESIGEVPGAGNSNVLRSYHFTDVDPYEGISYYRLQQNDKDGQVSYTDLVAVKNIKSVRLSIYPNPSDGEVDFAITSHRPAAGHLSIMDATGRMVLVDEWSVRNGISTKHLDLSSLKGGVYFVKLMWGSGLLTQQLVLH